MIDLIKSAADRMLIDFEDNKKIDHNLTKGEANEYTILTNFLKPYLPKRYSICSGIVVDVESKQSRQQDLIIYDDFYSPVLKNMEDKKILFAESVFAIFEVKTTLRHGDIKDILKKSSSIWSLSKTKNPNITLAPGQTIRTFQPPSFCAGICFESELSLDKAIDLLRKERKESDVNFPHSLSILTILNDKEGKSGIIINVNEKDLRNILLLPNPNSRFAKIEFDNAGDTILYTYLLLMEHLKNAGMFTPGPNLLQYAESGELGFPSHQIKPEETKGAHVNVEGKNLNMDEINRVRQLSKKVFSGESSDQEIMEFFHLIPKMPSGESLLHPQSKFYENDKVILPFTTREVIISIDKHFQGKASKEEETKINKFVELFNSVIEEGRVINMGPQPS